jgi:hypothetical protein
MLTPNGRWGIGKSICLSYTSHHPESWNIRWSIPTMIAGLQNMMSLTSTNELGSIQGSEVERRYLAEKSRVWCHGKPGKLGSVNHGELIKIFEPPVTDDDVVQVNHCKKEKKKKKKVLVVARKKERSVMSRFHSITLMKLAYRLIAFTIVYKILENLTTL